MKINFISYLNPFKYSGGGEMVNRRLIESGIERGHKITLTSAKNRVCEYDKSADLDFLVDIFNYPETLKSRGAWIHLHNNFIKNILSSRPFVHMTNAYSDVCNLGYLPCSGEAQSKCPHKSPCNLRRNIAAKDFRIECFSMRELVKSSFLNSILNIYMSPMHQRITNKILNINDANKSIIVKPIVNTDEFYDRKEKRDIEYLFVGVLSEAKGFENLKTYFSEKQLVMVGDIFPGIKLEFGKHLGKLPYSKIPGIMNRAKNFVFLPRWPEPQGRVVVEAALSGCNLIVNENVGAMSFPFDIANPQNVADSEAIFWNDLELRIKC